MLHLNGQSCVGEANSVAHYLAKAALLESWEALISEKKELKWVENEVRETPQALRDGLKALSARDATLHRAIRDGHLLHVGSTPPRLQTVQQALMWKGTEDDAESARARQEMEEALAGGRAAEVLPLAAAASVSIADRHVYSALAMIELKHGAKQVAMALRAYLEEVSESAAAVSPLLYYCRFRQYQQTSKTRLDRQQALAAMSALQCFPLFASRWLTQHDLEVMQDLARQESVRDATRAADADADDDSLAEDSAECAAAAEWELAKADHDMTSPAMDELMALTGLTEIKERAMVIVKEVLLRRGRPASVKAETSMNALFTGNPGCGKTTVAQLLARAMAELGFRSEGTLIETSAQEILKLKDPVADFQTMLENAKGGTLFIDEAYGFTPAKAGSQPNPSNQVLDYLLQVADTAEIRETTTIILAGYRDEIEALLGYNVGFASRFPLEFKFEDFSQQQLKQILVKMVRDRGMVFEPARACGVVISGVVARRLHLGSGRKGFGNARAVRNELEQIISRQSARIGTLKLRKQAVSTDDYSTLTAEDALGRRPDFSDCPPMQSLEKMVGLSEVKDEFRKLLSLAQQNFDREMRGEAPELIPLHRVFYGNPGTGKTTVAKLYGALLKELGLLSKGDFISVTPADLTGDAEGGAASNTKAILERARGKVLLIDEAYVLDPRRKNNLYGGNVLDTLVEKLDGEAGSDIAVILAGYKQDMFDMLENNPGLRRRFAIDDFGMHFSDMGDAELREVLVAAVAKAGLAFESHELIDAVVAMVAQKRRLPGFGNAATVNSLLKLAQSNKAARLDQAAREAMVARRQGTTPPLLRQDPDVLVRADFVAEEVDAATARDAFASLYNTDHIMRELDSLEALIMAAQNDGREAADILADAHMVFVGPPGTGKTTVANRFGKLFKDLNVLPSDTVTVVTGTSLMGQYVGETKEKVLKAMHQARGGILFIDEAYGIAGSTTGSVSFGREAIDTLTGSITSADFKGNLLVIMAGYEPQMDALMANANPGFTSRFNKKRIVFPAWSAMQAGDAVVAEIEKVEIRSDQIRIDQNRID